MGATAGIGRALALAIHDLPSQPTVIVSGRRQERLDELTQQSARVQSVKIDVTAGRKELETLAHKMSAQYPDVSLRGHMPTVLADAGG